MTIILILVLMVQISMLNKLIGDGSMYKLSKDSYVVLAWVTAVKVQGYPLEKVPEICGLKEIVTEIVKEDEA